MTKHQIIKAYGFLSVFAYDNACPQVYNTGQNIWKKIKKSSTIGQEQKPLITSSV